MYDSMESGDLEATRVGEESEVTVQWWRMLIGNFCSVSVQVCNGAV